MIDAMGRDYEALDEASEEADAPLTVEERESIAKEIAELRRYEALAKRIRDNAKGLALLAALDRAFQPRNGSWTAPRVRPAWCPARHNEAE